MKDKFEHRIKKLLSACKKAVFYLEKTNSVNNVYPEGIEVLRDCKKVVAEEEVNG